MSFFNPFRRTPSSWNTVPRIYGDGSTYLAEFESLRDQVNSERRELAALVEKLPVIIDEAVTAAMGPVNESIVIQNEKIELLAAEVARLREHVDEKVQEVIDSSIEVSDPVMFGVLSDPPSQSAALIHSWIAEG